VECIESKAGRNRRVSGAAHAVVMPVLVMGVLTMSAAQLLDLTTFMAMVDRLGPAAELNPIVKVLFSEYGYPMVAIAKVVLLAAVSGIVAILASAPARPRLAGAVIAVAILVGVVGGLSNAVALGAIDGAVHRAGLGGP
jgi:hypothetical protein